MPSNPDTPAIHAESAASVPRVARRSAGPVMHPHHLHAKANLWALDSALGALRIAQRAAAQAANAADYGTLQAWRPGAGISRSGGHGDILLDAVVRNISGVVDPYTLRARRTADTVAWVAKTALGAQHRDDVGPLTQLRDGLHTLSTATASNLARWIGEQDHAVRQLLGEPDDHHLIPTAECPACSRAGILALRMSGPAEDRVVVCTATSCTCAGDGCPCRMGLAVAGVRHVWTMAEFRAGAGA
ncbi:MAG: hypothetical protein ABW000_07190 [Actinoplanes sp.]